MTSHTEYGYTFIHHLHSIYKSDNIITEFLQYGLDIFSEGRACVKQTTFYQSF